MRQRNVRYQMAKKSRKRFSAPVSFNHTCELNRVWPCKAVQEICLDPPGAAHATAWLVRPRGCAPSRAAGRAANPAT